MLIDNPSKRSIQRKLLGRIIRHPHNQDPITVACLPGISGWDLQFFSGFDRVQRIIAIERDPEIAENLRQKAKRHPKVEVWEGTTTKFLSEVGYPVDLLYLDYFSNLNLSVLQDMELIFRRKVLPEGGKCMVSFYGARETDADQAAQRMLVEDYCERFSVQENWDDIEPDRRRCLAFNGLLARFRVSPLRRMMKQGHPDRIFVTTTSPDWHRYKTDSAPMLTGCFTLHHYTRTPTRGAISAALPCWFLTGHRKIKDVHRTHLSGFALMEGPKRAEKIYKKEILAFYEKHGYTPAVKDLGRSFVRRYTELVRELGLCPRIGATEEDVEKEMLRIFNREGTITWTHLHKAKLTKRRVFGSNPPSTAIPAFLNKRGIQHAVRSRHQILKDKRTYEWVLTFVQYIEAGNSKTNFRHYSALRRRGLHYYDRALKELRRLQVLYGQEGPQLDPTTPGEGDKLLIRQPSSMNPQGA